MMHALLHRTNMIDMTTITYVYAAFTRNSNLNRIIGCELV